MNAEDLRSMYGRRVLLEARIIDNDLGGPGNVMLEIMVDEGFPGRLTTERIHVSATAIREILPEPIKVGDRARKPMVQGAWPEAVVLAIHKGRAWVEYDDGRRDDWAVDDLSVAAQ